MSVDPSYYYNTGGPMSGLHCSGGNPNVRSSSSAGAMVSCGGNVAPRGNFVNSSDNNQMLGFPSFLNQHSIHSLSENVDKQLFQTLTTDSQHNQPAYNMSKQEMFVRSQREGNVSINEASNIDYVENFPRHFDTVRNNPNICQTITSPNVDSFHHANFTKSSSTSYLSSHSHNLGSGPSGHVLPPTCQPSSIEMPYHQISDLNLRYPDMPAGGGDVWRAGSQPPATHWQTYIADSRHIISPTPAAANWHTQIPDSSIICSPPAANANWQTQVAADGHHIGSPQAWPRTAAAHQNGGVDDKWQPVTTAPVQQQHHGLEFLYHETDKLMRNRSSSMTDVLHRPDIMAAKRNFQLLEHEVASLRLDENLESPSTEQYPMRRGSGTFHRPAKGQAMNDLGRRRFPSMDPALFSSGGGGGPQVTGLGQESILSSLLSNSSSSIFSQELIWSPLVNPSKSISPADLSGSEENPIEEFVFQSDDDDDKLINKAGRSKKIRPKKLEKSTGTPSLHYTPNVKIPERSMVGGRGRGQGLEGNQTPGGATSWSQIVRTKTATQAPAVRGNPTPFFASCSPLKTRSVSVSTSPCSSPSPTNMITSQQQTAMTAGPGGQLAKSANEYHRGPKVDPRWPVENQVFLGPIPVAVTWEEIRNTFYEKVDRQQILHTYVQSKPVNDVVYGQIVFDKPATSAKILKDGFVKVGGHQITVTAMKDKTKASTERKR